MFKALIIGAGQIAAGFDTPSDSSIRTHAHAYKAHDAFELLGFYDKDFAKAEAMAEKWRCRAFAMLADIGSVDVVSICVPDEFHAEMALTAASVLHPKCIFIEKPVVRTEAEMRRLADTGIPFLVNYSRRFSAVFQELSARIHDGEFGSYRTGTGYYGKGFRHNGSHMIDLLRLLIGSVKRVDELGRIPDFTEDDPTKTALLHFAAGGSFVMQGCDSRNFTIFELVLIFDKARIQIHDTGNYIEIDRVAQDLRYAGYVKLERSEPVKTDMDFVMLNAVNSMEKMLSYGAKSICSLEDGWEAVRHG